MMFQRRFNEGTEQGVSVTRCRGKFRVELAGEKPGVVFQLDHFYQAVITGCSTDGQAGFDQLLHIVIVKFITVTMAFNDRIAAIYLTSQGTGYEITGLAAKPPGAAKI
jgi:hypothetical protein